MNTGPSMLAIAAAAASLIALPAASATNLVENGGFETGDFTGFTVHDPDEGNWTNVHEGVGHSGNFGVELANYSHTPAVISQSIETIPNQTYNVSFYYSVNLFPYTPSNGLVVSFDDHVLLSLQDLRSSPYTLYSYQVTAKGANSTVSFSAYNSAYYSYLDDISVTLAEVVPPVPAAVPEPASWATIIVGFGAIGAAMRRRRKVAVRFA